MTKKIHIVYNIWSKVYDQALVIFNTIFVRKAEKEFVKLTSKYIKKNSDILDLGVGTGNNIRRLLKLKIPFKSYEGIDITPSMLAKAKKHYGNLENVTFREGDITKLHLTKKYDVIISTWVFSHLKNQDEIVKQLRKQLNKDGHLILIFLSEKKKLIGKNFWNALLKWNDITSVPFDMLEKFPKAVVEKHYPWMGGNTSIYVFESKN